MLMNGTYSRGHVHLNQIMQTFELSMDQENPELRTLNYTEHKLQDMNEIDPENNFFHNIQIHCEYYTDEQFNVTVKMDRAVSIIHFNSRSLNSNFSKIKQC